MLDKSIIIIFNRTCKRCEQLKVSPLLLYLLLFMTGMQAGMLSFALQRWLWLFVRRSAASPLAAVRIRVTRIIAAGACMVAGRNSLICITINYLSIDKRKTCEHIVKMFNIIHAVAICFSSYLYADCKKRYRALLSLSYRPMLGYIAQITQKSLIGMIRSTIQLLLKRPYVVVCLWRG